jgi:hypothetical protein
MNRPTRNGNTCRLILLRTSFGMFCALSLNFAPPSLFAQHSGGSGGSHAGGGGGGSHASGSAHGSGGGHSGPSAGSSTGTHAGRSGHSGEQSHAVATSGGLYAGSHIWGGSRPGSSASSVPVERFAAGNNVWQEPPGAHGGTMANSAVSAGVGRAGQNNSLMAVRSSSAVRTAHGGPLLGATQNSQAPRIFIPRPRHRFFSNDFFIFGGGCFGGFFPGFCGSTLWWGPRYAWGPGCDPVLGCTGYGYPNNVPDDADQMQVQSNLLSHESGPFRWQDSPAVDSADLAAASKPAATIYLKDGSSYGVTDYWLAGGELNYITNYGGGNSIPSERLDLQRTVDENSALGVSFILSNKPTPRE